MSRPRRYAISAEPSLLDVKAIHRFLSGSYWAKGRRRAVVKKSLKHSFCLGVYLGREQVGLARVITDYATFAYLCDVYIQPDHQARGLGKRLVSAVMKAPALKKVPSWCLRTRDAHGLYRQLGFKIDRRSSRWMRLRR